MNLEYHKYVSLKNDLDFIGLSLIKEKNEGFSLLVCLKRYKDNIEIPILENVEGKSKEEIEEFINKWKSI